MECGSHAAARKHGLRIPHVDVPMLRSFPVCDPVLAGSNGFSDSFLEPSRPYTGPFSERFYQEQFHAEIREVYGE